jgi:hypothetical protein
VNIRIKLALAVGVAGAMVVGGTAAFAGGASKPVKAWLSGYEEVPAVSTVANGRFEASLTPTADGLVYKLSYAGLEGDVTQAHIHFGQRGVAGGISTWLCGNVPTAPAGTQACPPSPATITGTIRAADIVGPAGQGIAPGELAELLRAIKAGMAYANVHSSKFPSGEIRAQLRGGWHRGVARGKGRD